jgi:hypothetical protein
LQPNAAASVPRAAARALLSARGEERACDEDADFRRLVACGALPDDTLPLLDMAHTLTADAGVAEIAPLLSSAARILAAIRRNEPSLGA